MSCTHQSRVHSRHHVEWCTHCGSIRIDGGDWKQPDLYAAMAQAAFIVQGLFVFGPFDKRSEEEPP